jgi:hypothetical protein
MEMRAQRRSRVAHGRVGWKFELKWLLTDKFKLEPKTEQSDIDVIIRLHTETNEKRSIT